MGGRRGGGVRALLPQFLHVPRPSRTVARGSLRPPGIPPARPCAGAAARARRNRAASAAAVDSSGRCSTGMRRPSTSIALSARRFSRTGASSASSDRRSRRWPRAPRPPLPLRGHSTPRIVDRTGAADATGRCAVKGAEQRALLREANEHEQAGRLAEAAGAYERLLARWPELPDSWYNLARLQRMLRRFDAALASYQQALDRNVSRPEEVHLNRGVIYSDCLRRDDAAARELETALALNPVYVPALANLANLHSDLGRRDEATRAVPENPRDRSRRLRIARALRGSRGCGRTRGSADRPAAARARRSSRERAGARGARLRARQGARCVRRLRRRVRRLCRRQPGEPRLRPRRRRAL